MGFFELLKHFFYIKKVFNYCLKDIIAQKPAVLFLVDFSEFTLRLAEKIKELQPSIKIVRFVSPQIWASRPKRIARIVKAFDSLCSILPFEKKIYNDYDPNFDAVYVGNPLLDQEKPLISKDSFFREHNLPKDKKIIAVLPGSRSQEIKKHLPIILKAISKLKNDYNFIFIKSDLVDFSEYNSEIEKLPIKIIKNNFNQEAIKYSDLIWSKSGTSTLQVAILLKPAIVFYKVNLLTYLIAKRIVKTKYISLVNILANKEIYKELIQNDFNAQQIILETEKLEKNQAIIEAELVKVRESLAGKAAYNTAKVIRKYLKQP